jgi:hypothetical protein
MLDIFTIVLNGMPYIREHLPVFSRLRIPWRWHIVEGVAKPVGCGRWNSPVRPTDHQAWLSNDGTTEYLNSIQCDQVRLYRPPVAAWEGKLEMVNAPLTVPWCCITPGSVLHEMDVDEFWTTRQLETIHELFTTGGAGRGWYWCDYYLGPTVHMANRSQPGNEPGHAWVRTHRYTGQPWTAHEPPVIPFEGREAKHAETESLGLVFKHFAYVTEAQIQFKENYYRYSGLVAQWKALQANTNWPVNPAAFLRHVQHCWGGLAEPTEHYLDAIKKVQEAPL